MPRLPGVNPGRGLAVSDSENGPANGAFSSTRTVTVAAPVSAPETEPEVASKSGALASRAPLLYMGATCNSHRPAA